jgi:hypothetical protein
MKGGHRDEAPERRVPGRQTRISVSPSKNAPSYLIIGVLTAVSIWVILPCPWSTFVQNVFHCHGSSDLYLHKLPATPDSIYLGSTLSNMKLVSRFIVLALLSLVSRASPTDPQESFEFDCAALPYHLNQSNAPNTTVWTQYVAGGSTIDLSGVNSTCVAMNNGSLLQFVPFDVCRVAAFTATSARSGIDYEIWLPKSWTGRFISHGNGGLSGCITVMQI